ncbi:MAG: hypothetical protein QN201_09650 [Armatimonadota bacterium]|nr:hypothetical protein [Armatimonadota bacterium]
MDEQVTALRLLWTQELVTFEGRWHRIRGAGINPLPRRPIPLGWAATGCCHHFMSPSCLSTEPCSPWRMSWRGPSPCRRR